MSLSADAAAAETESQSWGLLHKPKCRLVPSGCLLTHTQYFSSLALLSSAVTCLLSDTRTMKNMTFRRVKKLNSNEPDSGSLCHDSGDIYFTSSKSDSCGTVDRGPSNSTEVYNYKTLAYSGGTLPRNFKKVRAFLFSFQIRYAVFDSCLHVHWQFTHKSSVCYDIYLPFNSLLEKKSPVLDDLLGLVSLSMVKLVFWVVLEEF